MRSSEFITEREIKPYEYHTYDSDDDTIAFIETHCQQAIAGGMLDFPLWRGMFNHNAASIVHLRPGTGRRESENTTNQYTAIMSNSPYFKGWPKRDRSLVCSTDFSYAGDFGQPFAILPFNNAKIGVCSSYDLWQTQIISMKLALPNAGARRISDIPQFLRRNFELPDTWNSIVKHVKTRGFADELVKYNARWHESSQPMTPEEFIPALQEMLSPKMLDLRLMSVKEFASAKPKNRECWLSADVVAIHHGTFDQVKELLRR